MCVLVLVSLLTYGYTSAAVEIQEQQLSKPITALYEPDEPESFKFKRLGKFENDVNELKNLTSVQVRGEEHGLVEGDMIAPRVQKQIENINSSRPVLQKGVISGLWPNGRIAYTFATSITSYKKDVILQAIEHWSSQTCLTFEKKKKSDTDYVEFFNGGGCFSDLGRYGGKQLISISSRCVKLGIIVHEIGHTIGFYHEQSRPDRDTYVRIKLQNAKPGTSNNFAKYSRDYIDTHGTPYDYGSIMHYRTTAFSANGEPTIVPVVDNGTDVPQMGQRLKLSEYDVALAKTMYNCDVSEDPPPTPIADEEVTCEDKSSKCSDWADATFCTEGSFVVFMLQNCQVSCGVCKPTPDVRQKLTAELGVAEIRAVEVKKKSVSLEVVVEGATKVHIMYKKEDALDWGYGLYRMYMQDEPVYTIYNLRRNTIYYFVMRYTTDGERWSEFSDYLTLKTRRTGVPRGRVRTQINWDADPWRR